MARKRKCKNCSNYIEKEEGFITPTNMFFCSRDCAFKYSILASKKMQEKQRKKKLREFRKKEKLERKEKREKKLKLKPIAYWRNRAQNAFNAYIRERDINLGCISCGAITADAWHAGHWLSRGAHPELAFDERNCHKQCNQCNIHKSGNVLEYRKNLIIKIGLAEVEDLESKKPLNKYTKEDFQAIEKKYKAKLKKLKEKHAMSQV